MDSLWTVIAVSAASAVVLALVAALLLARRRRARARRRFDAVLEQLDDHLGAIADTLRRVVERSAEARARGVDDLELIVDFDALLRRTAAEAAARTAAEAAVIQVQGPGGVTATARFGGEGKTEPLEAPLAHAAGPFRAVTVNWTYRPGFDRATDAYATALVVPLVEAGVETGKLAVYAPEAHVFEAEHIRKLESLAEDAASAIADARRFAEANSSMTDALTGLRNQKGYEIELERAVGHAQATGLPLSLLVLNRDSAEADVAGSDEPQLDLVLQQLATLLIEATRATDLVCRPDARRFAVLLPETTGEAARLLYERLRDQASRKTFPLAHRLAFTAGIAEWRPNETSDAFEARASATVGSTRFTPVELAPGEASHAPETGPPEPRSGIHERLGEEIARAREQERPLSLLVVELEGLHLEDEATVDRVLSEVETRLGAGLQNGDVTARVADDELAVILTGSTATEAESVFASLQASLETDPLEGADSVAVSAGITQLAAGDGPGTLFGRAEHALWRAKRAGRGTVVVAIAAESPRR